MSKRPPVQVWLDAWLPDPELKLGLETMHRFCPTAGLEGKEAVFPEPLDVCCICKRTRLVHRYQYGLGARAPMEWTYQLTRNVQLLEWREKL